MDRSIDNVLAAKGRGVHMVEVGTSVKDAVAAMNEQCVGSLLVTMEGDLVGIFSERDVLVRVVAAGRDPATTTVGGVMTRDPHVVTPKTTVMQALTLCTDARCRHLPVVDGGTIVGLVSIGDLTKVLTDELESEVRELSRYISSSPCLH